jgi:hypothetical protein
MGRNGVNRSACLVGVLLLLVGLLGSACQGAPSFDQELGATIKPYQFSILRWQLHQVLGTQSFSTGEEDAAASGEESDFVLHYFNLVSQARALRREINAIATGGRQGDLTAAIEELDRLQAAKALIRSEVQRIIGDQIRATLDRQGIYNPLDRFCALRVGFPPISFRLDRPPNVLIISPRDRIESIREVMLVQDLGVEQFAEIEAQVDALGVSAMVTELGGFGGTYPTFVADDVTLPWTLSTATEEWLHQYLAFTPLGFRYVLDATGLARNYEIATMNETLAGIVSDEIAQLVLDTYYYPQSTAPSQRDATQEDPFEFARFMRELRLEVDDLLADGQIEEAEQLMEERRQILVSKGYYIRKLNQAYFAFYGTYADEPTSVDPIGVEMKALRRASASLRTFLKTATAMTSRQDLIDSLEQPPDEGGQLAQRVEVGLDSGW